MAGLVIAEAVSCLFRNREGTGSFPVHSVQFVMDSLALGQVFFPAYFAFPLSVFHQCFIFIPVIRGLDSSSSSGRRSKTVSHATPRTNKS